MQLAVFASTNGTDFQAILDAKARGELSKVDIRVLIVNKEDCGAVEKALNAQIPVEFVDPLDEEGKKVSREEYDQVLDEICQEYEVDTIACIGWMRILSPWFVKRWEKNILNVHPSLLPKYPGMDLSVHEEVLKNAEKETGMTIHYIDEGVDSGEILLQKSTEVLPDDTAESLKKRVQELEKAGYVEVLEKLSQESAA